MIWILKRLLLLILLLEIPFSYKVCQTRELQQYLAQLPASSEQASPFRDLRGTLHIHSAAGGHSTASYPEIIEAAKNLDFDYLFFTEHPREPSIFRQIQDPELILIYGEEKTRDGYRFLTADESAIQILAELSALEPTDSVPEEVTALEIYNMHENGEKRQSLFQWINFLHHQLFYPELFYFHLWEVSRDHIERWNSLLKRRKIAATAGNDAHQNIGIILQTAAGQRLFAIIVDPYQYTLKFVTNHILLELGQPDTPEAILKALAHGASYIAFEGLADPTGFSFHARSQSGQVLPMGATVAQDSTLVFQSPIPCRFRLYHDGSLEQELEGSRFEYPVLEPGTYRVEAYLINPPSLIEGNPWIISNPIYINR